ncbi:hypothetical protein DU505_00620 [Billgrantia montanilacus]|uniref:Uncharacterized protein n=2 Tax=Billgrantia montanilacus TaxID=2282305 RepID=A0A368U3K8_9GAMM|nr:hypothetical protein DU505_00620 [Halomonas montanilacus]
MSQITQMMAANQGRVVTQSPIFGPFHPALGFLSLSLIDPEYQISLGYYPSDFSAEDGLIANSQLLAIFTNRQVDMGRRLSVMRHDLGSCSPIMLVKHHGRQGERVLQYTPASRVGIDGANPDYPLLMGEAKVLASILRPELISLMQRVISRWSNRPVDARNADAHDGIIWLWLVADELGLSSSQFDEVNWTMHRSARYIGQSQDLLIRT